MSFGHRLKMIHGGRRASLPVHDAHGVLSALVRRGAVPQPTPREALGPGPSLPVRHAARLHDCQAIGTAWCRASGFSRLAEDSEKSGEGGCARLFLPVVLRA